MNEEMKKELAKSAQLANEAAQTLDGWYVLHDLRSVDWASWRMLAQEERNTIVQEFVAFLDELQKADDEKTAIELAKDYILEEHDLTAEEFDEEAGNYIYTARKVATRDVMEELDECNDALKKDLKSLNYPASDGRQFWHALWAITCKDKGRRAGRAIKKERTNEKEN